VKNQGGEIHFCRPTLADREATAQRIREQTGATFVPPFDSHTIIAGQGTAALELINEVTDLDAIVTPVGGGGLLSGSAIVANAHDVRIIGAEPAQAADAQASLLAGERITHMVANTIADGLRTPLGEKNFAIIKKRVEHIVIVSEADIISSLGLFWRLTGMTIEPSSAVALAAVLANPGVFKGQQVGIIISGGNVDPQQAQLANTNPNN
jgi:threonine dehydratase